jgi:hypothetical protein
LLARLEQDARLRKRHGIPVETGARITAALDGLLKNAPLDRLRAATPQAEASPIAPRLISDTVRALAVGILIGFLAAGIAAWTVSRYSSREEQEDWRTVVVEYMEL